MIEHRPDSKNNIPEETRERIILAAREVIKRKGKRGATTREIADVAGVNEATLFRHFGNKEALIVEVARYTCPDVQIRDLAATLEGPIEQQLLTMAQMMSARMESMIDMIRWSLVETEYENSLFARETWRPQTAVHAAVTDFMKVQVEKGTLSGNPEDLAEIFMGMIFARVIASEKFPNSRIFRDAEYALPFMINVFLNGVRSK
jgi:AcrR family transcriptional regulator